MVDACIDANSEKNKKCRIKKVPKRPTLQWQALITCVKLNYPGASRGKKNKEAPDARSCVDATHMGF